MSAAFDNDDDRIDLPRLVEDDHVDQVAAAHRRIDHLEALVLQINQRLQRLAGPPDHLDTVILAGPNR